ncbi:hypothetical protein [Tropicimonas sp.]|uniref:hypothetical protein n=1 Tax=Tropicimonas sp. TaxID=2067044 RepID=UPI003A8B78C6
MSHSYSIHPDLDLIVMRYSGHVTLNDLRDGFVASIGDPRYRPGMMELSDFSAADDTDVGFAGVMAIADKVRESYASSAGIVRIAHCAPSDIAYGMARMYQTIMSDEENVAIGLFRSLPEALEFLNLNTPEMIARLERDR